MVYECTTYNVYCIAWTLVVLSTCNFELNYMSYLNTYFSSRSNISHISHTSKLKMNDFFKRKGFYSNILYHIYWYIQDVVEILINNGLHLSRSNSFKICKLLLLFFSMFRMMLL